MTLSPIVNTDIKMSAKMLEVRIPAIVTTQFDRS